MNLAEFKQLGKVATAKSQVHLIRSFPTLLQEGIEALPDNYNIHVYLEVSKYVFALLLCQLYKVDRIDFIIPIILL